MGLTTTVEIKGYDVHNVPAYALRDDIRFIVATLYEGEFYFYGAYTEDMGDAVDAAIMVPNVFRQVFVM